MTDYGRDLQFGVSVDPTVADLAESITLAQHADRSGVDLVAVQDHAYQPGHVDTWTLLTYLSAATENVSFMPDVADLQLRPPAMLAKAASTLSILGGGRLQLGVGGGPFPDAIAGMGAPRREPRRMVAYADAAVDILIKGLRGGPVEAGNDEHRVSYVAGPSVVDPPQVWLGAQHRRMLDLVGRRAQGWVAPLQIYVPPPDVPEKQRIIDDAARAAGRDPSDIRRIYNVIGTIGDGRRARAQGLVGDPAAWTEFLTDAVVDLGFDTFIFWPTTDPTGQLDMFMREVVPAVRARVATERNS